MLNTIELSAYSWHCVDFADQIAGLEHTTLFLILDRYVLYCRPCQHQNHEKTATLILGKMMAPHWRYILRHLVGIFNRSQFALSIT